MEFNSGEDLISMKETLQRQPSLSTQSPPSNLEADEYARYNGLTIDNFTDPWSIPPQHDDAIASTLTHLDPGDLIEDAALQECYFRSIPTSEQWELPPKSLAALQDSVKRCKVEEVATLMDDLCFAERNKNVGLEYDPPLLRSDHEEDCRRLARRVNAFRKVPLPDHRLPVEPADVTKGEGLEFPSIALEKDKLLMKRVEEEKLSMDHDNLKYLMESIKADWTVKDQKELIESTYPYHGIGAAEPLTPPLSPVVEPPAEEFVPDEETCYIPSPSAPSSELSADIRRAESQIFRDDEEFWAQVRQNSVSPEMYVEVDTAEMLRAGQFRSSSAPATGPEPVPRDFHVDVPIFASPWHDDNDRERFRVLTREDMDQMNCFVTTSDRTDDTDEHLISIFMDRATNIIWRVEQEQLQPLDAVARVGVPLTDFSISRPEWEEQQIGPEALMGQIRKTEDVDWEGPKWHYNRAAEQKMVWAPLAHMRRRSLVSENIEVDAELLNRFLDGSEDNDAPTSADYVHKQQGLAILRMDIDEDDEYIVSLLGLSEPSASLVIAKKPLVLAQGQEATPTSVVVSRVSGAEQQYLRGVTERATGEGRALKKQKTMKGSKEFFGQLDLEIMDGLVPHSPSTQSPSTQLLAGYERQFPEIGQLINRYADTHFPKPPEDKQIPETPAAIEAIPDLPPSPEPIPAVAPDDIVPPTPPPKVIISSTVTRPIIIHLEKILPGIEIIARDYGAHAPPGWAPGMRSPNLDDADITVSSSTGILASTMVKLRQRPVPGQPGVAPDLRQVIQNVAVRYERLVVIISEGNKHAETMTPLSQGDAKALAEFQGFLMGLDTEARMLYVGGGIETLAKWTAKIICDHGEERPRVRKLVVPGQSYWEVFLHRAGMNVFAAQVILGALPRPDEEKSAVGGPEEQAPYGLPFFVQLPREGRIEMFEPLIRCKKVLERVSQVIDEPWGQLPVDGH
ncbi:hypothetical protein QBC43DRAFT_324385 [Cladorrhinum sp. PSN259]|nr:hypothetical protein QBC43DRAFT_324385 [Cladorrhinum sp. PSN259]